MPKFSNLSYKDMHKMNHNGVGHRTGQNIVTHVLSMLDDTSHYKEINGKLHVRDIHEHRNGRYKVRKTYIPVSEHIRMTFPRLRNPSANIRLG